MHGHICHRPEEQTRPDNRQSVQRLLRGHALTFGAAPRRVVDAGCLVPAVVEEHDVLLLLEVDALVDLALHEICGEGRQRRLLVSWHQERKGADVHLTH